MIRPDRLTSREEKFCIITIVLGLVIFFVAMAVSLIFEVVSPSIYALAGVGVGLSFAPFFMGE